MKKNSVPAFLLLLLFAPVSHAQQKTTQQAEQLWAGYFNQTRLTGKLGFWLDLQLRTREDFVQDLSQFIVRPGLTYYLNDATKLTAGYAYIHHYPADAHKQIAQPEHRPWQQLQWHTRYGKLRTMQYLRLEQRYRRKILNDSTLASGHNFNHRLRYAFLLQVPLAQEVRKGSFSLIANDEVHIAFGKQVLNYFDQNRFFLGFAYHVNAHDNVQLGYMNLFQQLGGVGSYRSIHAARIFYFHNLDLRRK